MNDKIFRDKFEHDFRTKKFSSMSREENTKEAVDHFMTMFGKELEKAYKE